MFRLVFIIPIMIITTVAIWYFYPDLLLSLIITYLAVFVVAGVIYTFMRVFLPPSVSVRIAYILSWAAIDVFYIFVLYPQVIRGFMLPLVRADWWYMAAQYGFPALILILSSIIAFNSRPSTT